MDQRTTILVTGANSGVGYGIVDRILQSYRKGESSLEDTELTLVMLCRDMGRAGVARKALIRKHFKHTPEEGEEIIQLVQCDLADMKSVIQAASDIRSRFPRIDALVCNAGVIPVKSVSMANGVYNFFVNPTELAKTTGEVLVQRKGVLTQDGQYGLAFAANTLGHYILLKELEGLLEESGKTVRNGVKIVWMTSVTVADEYFDLEDLQGVKGDHPYEASKYVMEVMHAALGPNLREKGIYSFLASPGIVATNITQGKVPVFLVAWLLVLMVMLATRFHQSARCRVRFGAQAYSGVAKFPIKTFEFEPHGTLEHPLHGSTASTAPQPAIIVLQEWWGISMRMSDFCEDTGARTVIPDLYNGKVTADAEEASHLMNNLDWDKALAQLVDIASHLQVAESGLKRKVGATGFCMGGALSLALAGKMSGKRHPLNAVVSFYGTPPAKFDISRVPEHTPTQAHFGSEDTYVGFSDVTAARALAEKWNLAIKKLGGIHAHGLHSNESHVYIHEGLPHAFMNQLGKSLSPEHKKAIDSTWEKVFAFFIEHLKTV
ncbi:hypothetical protein HDU96_001203 [Phlyctochytrium bullatum]|nr:hypothetical protein HDU96_001203 [Phlyctochytrium bullatum]